MSVRWSKLRGLRRQLQREGQLNQYRLKNPSCFSPERFFSSSTFSSGDVPAIKAFSSRVDLVLQDSLWLIPRKNTGR